MARTDTEQANTWRVLDIMEISGALKGVSVVFTGHLGLSRTEVAVIVQRAGGRVEDSVRWGVKYLVTNKDWTRGSIDGGKSNKFRKAEELGVKILSEQQFIDLIVSQAESPLDK